MKRLGIESDDETIECQELVDHKIYNGDSDPVPAPLELDDSTSLDFGFQLDLFQMEAIKAVNTGNSVLVVASTSAGKSVIAYHAISKSIEAGSVAVYTAPVKSLANQKFVELSQKFDDVGLITGDVTNAPSAKCLVMTAEVLRNQIFSGSANISKVMHIILDEAHYISDEQRGVVWEQIIIAAPENTKFVLLTATLPNYSDLAKWVSIVHKTPVHCIFQKRRPVPLHIHAIKETGSNALIKEGDKPLDSLELSKICATTGKLGSISQNSTLPKDPLPFEVANNANTIVSQGNYPLLLFCLSRRRCFKIAKHINGVEGSDALDFFDSAAEDWDPQIKSSAQFDEMRDLLSRGVAVHHSGIIPIIRETIELLFSTGKILVLVATETFALGVNAPARAVMFASLVKWGGSSFRTVSSSEFLQMAGRAGRRGFDEHGNVYIFVNKGYDPVMIASIVGDLPKKLESQMRVTPSLVLSCISMHIDPHEFLKKSLLFYMNKKELPHLYKLLGTQPDQPTNESINSNDNEKELKQYATLLRQITNITLSQPFIKDAMKKGRLVYIIHDGVTWGWSSVNSFENSILTCLVPAKKDEFQRNIPSSTVNDSFIASIKFPLSAVYAVSNITMKNPETITGASRVAFLLSTFDAVKKKHGFIPLFKLDKSKISKNAQNILTEFNSIETSLMKKKKQDYIEKCSVIEQKISIEDQINQILNPPCDLMIDLIHNLLIELQYITDNNTIQLKGRIALSLHVDNPIPIVELMFSGVFSKLNSTELCIAVSCFVESQPKVKSQKSPANIALWGKIENCLKNLQEKLINLGLPKLELPKKRMMNFVSQFLEKKNISEAISNINGLTDGIAVRILKRLRELLTQFEEAAKLMNVDSLVKSFNDSQILLLQDSNFESSLYKGED